MSVDTYFCCCCLSTNELSSIYSCEADKNYAELLKELFRVKILSEDHDDDSYVCDLCAKRLKLAYELKSQVETTLKMLQTYGLIIIEEKDGEMYVKKSSTNFIDKEDKYELETKWLDAPADLKSNIDKSIKEENVELYKDTVQTTTESNIVSTATVTYVVLERDKAAVSGKKGKKQHEVKKDNGYKVNRDFKCEVCEVKLPNIYVYHTHMNGHYPNHICEACGKGFLTERRLKRHMPSHKRGTFKCDSCDAVFTNYNTLCSHRQRKHSSVELYKCPECGLRFATLTRRAQHLAAAHAHPTGTYACRLCNKQFLLSGNLSAHMRNKHLKIKRHHCSECGAGFYYKQELTGHMAVHTGLNQFQCTLCNKRYPRKKALEVHRRIHTNDKRFSCDTCGKKFLQKCTLQSHLKTHAANKSHEI